MLDDLAAALFEALQDEYKARATYRAILNRFGSVRPFINILESEERHIQALLPLFNRYGIPVPEDNWSAQVEVPDSLAQACEGGVQAEIENGAMYERLLAMTAVYPDVQQVFRQLQRASQQNHLPAFQRCVARAARHYVESDLSGQQPAGRFCLSPSGCGQFGSEDESQSETPVRTGREWKQGRRRRHRRGNYGQSRQG